MDGIYELLKPRRAVSDNPRYKSGLFYSEKCKRNVQYESGLELEFVKNLETNKKVLFYWDQPVKVRYRTGKHPHYTIPDYGIYLDTREIVIAEVKPLPEMLSHRVQAKMIGLMEFCSTRGFGLLLTDGRHTPSQLLRGKVNRKLEKELLEALDVGIIRKEQCREIITNTNATQSELYRIIIKHNLKFKSFPFTISRGNINPIYTQVFFERKSYDDLMGNEYLTSFR